KVKQDVGGLRDDELAGSQERRRIRRAQRARVVHELHHRLDATLAAARHVDVIGAGLLEREPDELAATLNVRPIVGFVAHRAVSPVLSCSPDGAQATSGTGTPAFAKRSTRATSYFL